MQLLSASGHKDYRKLDDTMDRVNELNKSKYNVTSSKSYVSVLIPSFGAYNMSYW